MGWTDGVLYCMWLAFCFIIDVVLKVWWFSAHILIDVYNHNIGLYAV